MDQRPAVLVRGLEGGAESRACIAECRGNLVLEVKSEGLHRLVCAVQHFTICGQDEMFLELVADIRVASFCGNREFFCGSGSDL